jgi:hypothetical protein
MQPVLNETLSLFPPPTHKTRGRGRILGRFTPGDGRYRNLTRGYFRAAPARAFIMPRFQPSPKTAAGRRAISQTAAGIFWRLTQDGARCLRMAPIACWAIIGRPARLHYASTRHYLAVASQREKSDGAGGNDYPNGE